MDGGEPPGAARRAGPVCDECGVRESRYRCPRCAVRTCSVACCKAHKAASGCDGRASAVVFVSRAAFGERELRRDFRFLEDAHRTADNAHREAAAADGEGLGKELDALVGACKEAERDVVLRVMPASMSRRRANTTEMDWGRKELLWRIEWVFADAEPRETVAEERVSELTTVRAGLDGVLDGGDAARAQRLERYRARRDGVGCFVLVNGRPANDPRYVRLDADATIQAGLRGLEVVEFPTIVVALPGSCERYPLLEAGEEPAAKRMQR